MPAPCLEVAQIRPIDKLDLNAVGITEQATPHVTAAEGHRDLLLTMAMEKGAGVDRRVNLCVWKLTGGPSSG
jgi:hypothetical protein